ncbi:MAG: amino acid adenylation domain-containing protein, partial [bacterium]|nr:amino acid adenylation domain-containing protein [bacterium]
LQRYNNTHDVVFGIVVSGRPSEIEGVEQLVGLFINTVPLRINAHGDIPFNRLVHEVRVQSAASAPFHYVSLAEIQVGSNLKGELIHHIMAFENYPVEESIRQLSKEGRGEKGFRITDVQLMESTHYDFNIIITPGNRYTVTFRFNANVHDEGFIKEIANHFIRAAVQVVGEPGIPVDKIEILAEKEKKEILEDFNDTSRDYPSTQTIHQLFETQVEKTPDRIALEHLSYRELNNRANKMAFVLNNKGVKPNTIVAIMGERSIETVIGILGILQAGAAYLPIDPGLPGKRVEFMLRDSGAKVLVAGQPLTHSPSYRLNLSTSCPTSPTGLAYIIYTSGTTGTPKGVMIEHRSLVNLCAWHNRFYSVTPADRASCYANLGFDASVWEMFPYLVAGSSLHIVPEDIKLDMQALNHFFERHCITIGFLPTPVCEQFMQMDNRSLRFLLTGGDRLRSYTKRSYGLVNNYGPTENTVVTTGFMVTKGTQPIPIGKPIDNNRVYILDRNNHIQPKGVPGELCINGASLARGYLNRPELTSEKFLGVQNRVAFSSKKGFGRRRQYKTGDLACWLPDGNILFLGRVDRQVKIRGYRIQLGEIENRLRQHETVDDAVVLSWKDKEDSGYLCAYVVTGQEADTTELKEYLSTVLPGYMVPSYFVKIDEIPLTANGKLDERALPVPRLEVEEDYIAPSTPLQAQLVKLWADVLGIEESIIGIESDFFQLGGHSLKITILAGKIHKALNIKIPFGTIFNTPTIGRLADYIEGLSAAEDDYETIEPAEEKEYYLLSPVQERLYITQQTDKDSLAYMIHQAVLMEGELDGKRFEANCRKLVQRHESFRTSFEVILDEPVQRVHKDAGVSIDYFESSEEETTRRIESFRKPFDLSMAPLLRVGLIKLTGTGHRHILLVDMHHIISDGTSVAILMKEFMQWYKKETLPPLTLRYKDFSEWSRRRMESGDSQEFWMKEFEGEITRLHLPLDYRRPAQRSFDGKTLHFSIGEHQTARVKQRVSRAAVTPFIFLLSIFNVMLAKLTGQEDIIVGTGVEGREREELRRIIGMFVNTLALRHFPGKIKTFNQFLKEVKEKTLKAFENQDYPLEEVVEIAGGKRENSGNPLFDVMFEFNNYESTTLKIPDLTLKPYEDVNRDTFTSKFDLTLWAWERGNELVFAFQYSTQLFKEETIEIFIHNFKQLIASVLQSPQSQLKEMGQLPEDQKLQLLLEMNRSFETEDRRMKESGRVIQHVLTESLEKNRHRIAIQYGETCLSYRELDNRSNRIAHRLMTLGVNNETFIGLLIDDRVNLILSMLGIFKARAVFVPLDPVFPPARLEFMKETIGMEFIVTGSEEWFGQDGDGATLPVPYYPGDKIYVYFTSGSTGTPEAIVGKNESVLHFIQWEIDTFRIDHTVNVSQLIFPGFDAFLRDVFVPLCSGGKLCIPSDQDTRTNGNALSCWLESRAVNLIHCVPSLFRI